MTEAEPSDYLSEERARRYTYPWYTRLLARARGFLTSALYFLGYDLSAWQISANPAVAKAQGMLFVFVRALYGLYQDVKFSLHWNTHKGITPRGPYLYYKDNEDPLQQAEKLKAVYLAQGGGGELPPVVDIESIANPTLTASKIRACVERVYELFGDVIIYTGFYVWRDEVQGDKGWASAYWLWLAAYPFVDWKDEYFELVKLYPPLVPAPWTAFDLWQFTSKLPAARYGVSGTYLDGNYATEEFALTYNLTQPPDPPPGDPPMKYTTKISYTIRKVPNNTPESTKIGTIPQGILVIAQEIRFTDSNSAWVRIIADPSWLTDPNYTGETWIAGVHDGQGPFLTFVS